MPEVDDLLEAYLGEAQPNGTRRKPTLAKPSRSEKRTSGDLENLLSVYMQTVEANAQQEQPAFALPRSSDVDDLLRRYVLDQENVGEALESTLRQHLKTSDHPVVAADASPEVWAREMASVLRQSTGDLGQRLSRYASAVAEQDEKDHAFCDDHDSTLKGVPPPNAPPIALGSEMAKTIRKKTKSGNHSKLR
jgi:hypothetical protein